MSDHQLLSGHCTPLQDFPDTMFVQINGAESPTTISVLLSPAGAGLLTGRGGCSLTETGKVKLRERTGDQPHQAWFPQFQRALTM